MRISDWSSDVCSSDLSLPIIRWWRLTMQSSGGCSPKKSALEPRDAAAAASPLARRLNLRQNASDHQSGWRGGRRSEEHTSELQSLMRISYAVFCLKNKKWQMTRDNTPVGARMDEEPA